MRPRRERRGCPGFTMVEALVCVVLVGMLAIVAGALAPATRSAAHIERRCIERAHVRAKMEELLAGPLVASAGADTLAVRGEPVLRTWSAAPWDLDGDSIAEAGALILRVEMDGLSLETIRVRATGLDAIRR